NILFTIHEKTSTLTAQAIPSAPNGTTFPLIANASIVPSDVTFNSSFFGAEILISEPTEKFPDPLIYVSNRNLGPEFDERGDTIAIFEFKNANPCTTVFGYAGSATTACPPEHREHTHQWTRQESHSTESLTLLAQVFTGLKQIRSMSLGRVVDGGDEFLIAGANVDGGVVVFRRVDGDGTCRLSRGMRSRIGRASCSSSCG
ncbi:hypothetical protein BDQ12DRAFT_756153, partial [Crucibulum laeve]